MIRTFTRLSLLILLSAVSIALYAEPDVNKGKALFKANCAQCHNKNMKDKLTGPALGGVQERWAGRETLLYKWIRNSQAVIASGDPYAVNLYNAYNKSLMNPFPNLTDDDIVNILGYVDYVYKGLDKPAATAGTGAPAAGETQKGTSTWFYVVLVLVLAVLAAILMRIISNLRQLQEIQAGNTAYQAKTWRQILTSKSVVALIIFIAIFLGGYTAFSKAMMLGRQQSYEPDQPIKFSHATHAGLHKIDCNYCHDGARRSKHATIPAANTCMNCHKAIKKGSKYNTAEITKIFASIGYNPNTDTYIQQYESMPLDSIEAIYKKWIGNAYMEEAGLNSLDRKGRARVESQWKDILNSLTSETKPKVQGPVEWLRVHNLPDHVYFNHAQHVSAGKVACQSCHGKVEEMDVLHQYSTLSMGWCINCHRKTEVQFASNNYYNTYKTYHEELKSGKRQKVTVEEIGGLECQKCHY